MAAPHFAPEPPETRLSGADSFGRPATHLIYGEATGPGIVRPVPWTLELPSDELHDEGLTLLIPGYGSIQQFSGAERHANALAGEATISYEPPRLSETSFGSLLASQAVHTAAARAVLADARDCLASTIGNPLIRSLDTRRLTISAHSMGGFSAAALASETSARDTTLIYKAAVGFGAPRFTPRQLLGLVSIGSEIAYLSLRDQTTGNPRTARQVARYNLERPLQSAGEIITCLQRRLIRESQVLSERGVGMAYLAFGKDKLVPPRVIEANVMQAVGAFEIIPGIGHIGPQSHPAETAAGVRRLRQAVIA